MDKQKQLNEMHQILLSAGYDWWKTYPNGKTKSEYETECFYNAGYRKIEEGAVVLTREEYDEFLRQGAMIDFLKECNKEVRKGTAEKFAERLKEHPIAKTWFLYNADGKINVVIDEICKEISEGK